MLQCLFRILPWLVILGLLAACGGGSGDDIGDGRGPPYPSLVPRVASVPNILRSTEEPDYAAQKSEYETPDEYAPHLRMINAAAAYARGATGQGERIIIMDTGIRDTHREFTGTDKVIKETEPGYSPANRDKSHGTRVAALAVGNRDGEAKPNNMHGVAFEAGVYFFEIKLGSSDGIYRPENLACYTEADDKGTAEFLGNSIENGQGAIINYSFGVSGNITQYDAALVREKLSFTAATLAQDDTVAADKKIIVWAAGNAGSQRYGSGRRAPTYSPELWSGLGAYFPELQNHVLAVVALNQDGTIASYSNRCGLAKDFCLAAPGSNIVSASYTGDDKYSNPGSGTSFAAPLVSGSLALLRHFFRNGDADQLGNTELVNRLLATANRQGRYADSDIYGQGLVDLDAATRPVGAMMTSVPWDPNARPVAGMGLDLAGGAFGVRLSESLGAVEMVAFDQLGAPFPINLGQSLHPAARSGSLPRALRTRQARVPTASGAPARLELVPDASGHIDEVLLSFASGRGAPGLGRESGINPGMLRYAIESDKPTTDWWLSWGYHDGRALGLYRDGAAVSFLDSSAFAAPWLSLVQAGPGLGTLRALPAGGHLGFALMNGTPQHDGEAPADRDRGTGIILEYRPGARTPALQTGVVWEADGFLGAHPQGAFGNASGATTFAGINHRWSLNTTGQAPADWHILTAGYFGWTRPEVDGSGLLRGVSSLRSNAFSVGIERRAWWRPDDWIGVRISQPLRTESGTADLRLPTGRTKYGEVLYRSQRVDLAPSGRHLQAEAAWRGAFAGGEMHLSLGLERHAQQDTRRPTGFVGAVQFKRSF